MGGNLITIAFIGTSKYKSFFPGFYQSVMDKFCVDSDRKILVATDETDNPVFDKNNVKTTKIAHAGWPYVTLHRFKYLLNFENDIKESEYFFFIDADLWPASNININEITKSDKDFVGVQHPGFLDRIGTFETNTKSLANIFDGRYDLRQYRQGCFWGGKSEPVIDMIKTLNERIDIDDSHGITAQWHDESHMNKYFIERNDRVLTLHPGFSQPEVGYEDIRAKFPTKMVHLKKDDNNFPRFPGSRS